MWQEKRRNEIQDRIISRKRLRIKSDQMRLIKEDAELAMIEKLNQEKVLEQKKIDANFMRMWRMKRDDVHSKDIEARKAEKTRLKQINVLKKAKASILIKLLILISDSKIIWKEINEMWLTEQAKKLTRKRSRSKLNTMNEDDENDENHELILNESWIQRNFVTFDDDNQADARDNAKHAEYAEYAKNALNSWDL